MTLYFVGADKELLQLKIMNAGAIPTIVRLCASTHGDVQAEATDVLKVLSRNAAAGKVIVDAGEHVAVQALIWQQDQQLVIALMLAICTVAHICVLKGLSW